MAEKLITEILLYNPTIYTWYRVRAFESANPECITAEWTAMQLDPAKFPSNAPQPDPSTWEKVDLVPSGIPVRDLQNKSYLLSLSRFYKRAITPKERKPFWP